MNRVTVSDQIYLIGYQTQEFRCDASPLDKPIKCKGKNAWLGVGYYFWTELEFAHFWGKDFKKGYSGCYDIYRAKLDFENCINAVFDEEGYFFLRDKIEEAISFFKEKKMDVTLEMVNRFLADNIWNKLDIEGIIYDDKPTNSSKSDRIHSEIPDLYYKKRIQIVLFNLRNITNFELYLEEQT